MGEAKDTKSTKWRERWAWEETASRFLYIFSVQRYDEVVSKRRVGIDVFAGD